MEQLGIKNREGLDIIGQPTANKSAVATLQGISATFTDILNRAGSRLDLGVNAISDKAGISAIGPRDDHARDDLNADRNDDIDRAAPADRRDNHRDTDDTADARPDSRDSNTRDTQPDHRSDRADASDTDTAPRDRGQDANDRGNQDNANASASDTSRTDESDGFDSQKGNGETTTQTADGQADTSGEQTVSAGTDGSVNQAGSAEQAAQALLAHAVANPLAGHSQTKVQKTVVAAGSTAVDADGKAAAANAATQAANPQELAKGAHAATADGQTAKVAQQNGQAQAQAAQAATPETQDRKQAQANGIAAKLNAGQSIKVNVSVTDDAKTLVSKPGALASTVLISDDDAAQPGQRPGGQAGLSIAGQAQAAQTTAQAQTAAQAANPNGVTNQQNQAQLAAQSADGKAQAIQSAQGPSAGLSATSGGEPLSTQSSVSSGQTQQTQTQQGAEQARQTGGAHETHQARGRVVEQVSVQIAKAVAGQNDRIQIALKPAELGRVDVQIEMTNDGRAIAVVTADNKDTLELLRRDAAELAKALQDAGLKTDTGDLSFNLRGENAQADSDGKGGANGAADNDDIQNADADEVPLPADAVQPARVGVRGLAGIDLTA